MVSSRPLQIILFHTTTAIFVARTTNPFVTGFSSSSRRDVILGSGGAGLQLLSSSSGNDSVKMSVATPSLLSTSDPEDASIRWGIVGLGDVTQVKSGPPFWKCEGSELAAVMRRTPGKASEFAARVPRTGQGSDRGCVGYDNLYDFLKHPGLEAVYVATRPGTHSEIAKKVAEAGLACYVEKPVGRCAAETRELAEAFDAKGLPLYTAYISRAYERTQALRKLLRDGVIGDKLVQATYTLRGTGGARDMTTKELPWRLDASQSGGGLIMDVGCHILDRIDYLCGPLEQVKGSAEHRLSGVDNDNPEILVENYCQATAVTGPSSWASIPNGGCEGAKIDLSWDFSSTDENDTMDELVFLGSNGKRLKMAGMSPNGPIQVLDKDGVTIVEQSPSFDMPEHTAQRLIQAVTNDLIDRKTKKELTQANDRQEADDVLSFGDNALRTQMVIDTILESYYGGRESGYWSRADSWPGRPTSK